MFHCRVDKKRRSLLHILFLICDCSITSIDVVYTFGAHGERIKIDKIEGEWKYLDWSFEAKRPDRGLCLIQQKTARIRETLRDSVSGGIWMEQRHLGNDEPLTRGPFARPIFLYDKHKSPRKCRVLWQITRNFSWKLDRLESIFSSFLYLNHVLFWLGIILSSVTLIPFSCPA